MSVIMMISPSLLWRNRKAALSSAAISILLSLRGEWHYGSVYLGSNENGAFLGIRNRLTEEGFEYEDEGLPDELYERIFRAYKNLTMIR